MLLCKIIKDEKKKNYFPELPFAGRVVCIDNVHIHIFPHASLDVTFSLKWVYMKKRNKKSCLMVQAYVYILMFRRVLNLANVGFHHPTVIRKETGVSIAN